MWQESEIDLIHKWETRQGNKKAFPVTACFAQSFSVSEDSRENRDGCHWDGKQKIRVGGLFLKATMKI